MRIISKIRAVGSSKGVVLPKAFLDQCGIKESVTITIKGKLIAIAAKNADKKRWSDFKPRKKDPATPVSSKFDEMDWTW